MCQVFYVQVAELNKDVLDRYNTFSSWGNLLVFKYGFRGWCIIKVIQEIFEDMIAQLYESVVHFQSRVSLPGIVLDCGSRMILLVESTSS